MKITANSLQGRVLIVLRAGKISFSSMDERISNARSVITALLKNGLVERTESGWQITAAGREACPNRRDAMLETMRSRKSQAKQQDRKGLPTKHVAQALVFLNEGAAA